MTFDRISLEMIYRGLYHFHIAHQKGLASDPVKYFAAPENQDLGIVKRQRKPNVKLIVAPFPDKQLGSNQFFFQTSSKSSLTKKEKDTSPPQSLMGETNASRLRRETPTGCATCFMPGNPFGLRHLLYAGEPVHRSGLPSTASGLPSTTLAPQDRAALLDLSVEREKVFSLFKPLDLSMG